MSQQNINFGTFPDDPDADAIRTAFNKVQDNFTEVYGGISNTAVSSVIAGAGIQASSPTGNVVITANLACLQVHTSTLSIGRGSNGGHDATITASSQTLVLDLPGSIANVTDITISGNLSAGGNIIGANLSISGPISTSGNVTGGNIITTGLVTTTGNIVGANITTSGIISAAGNANTANLGTGLITASSNITGANLITGGLITASGNITGANLVTGGIVTATGNVKSTAFLVEIGRARV